MTAGSRRRSGRLAMPPDTLRAYLTEQRTCRVATVGPDGRPHVTPLWFVWDEAALWLNTLVRSARWRDLRARPQLAAVVDDGARFTELRGVELVGPAEVVGEVPRGGEPHPELSVPERLFAEKYAGTSTFTPDGRHAWVRVVPEEIRSWDFGNLTPR